MHRLTPEEAAYYRTNIDGEFEGIGARVGWNEEADTLVIAHDDDLYGLARLQAIERADVVVDILEVLAGQLGRHGRHDRGDDRHRGPLQDLDRSDLPAIEGRLG